MCKSFRVPMKGIASKQGIPEDDIIWRYLVEYSLRILYAHMFSIHVHDTATNPFIRLQTNLNDLFMNAYASLSAATLAHAFRIPAQRWQGLDPPLPVAFLYIVPIPSALTHISHMPQSQHSNQQHHKWASCWKPLKHPLWCHIWHTCQQG